MDPFESIQDLFSLVVLHPKDTNDRESKNIGKQSLETKDIGIDKIFKQY